MSTLLSQLEKRMQACKLVSRWSADPAYEDLCFSAHRSLIYLGDISRYWEMQAESKRRNWQTAERCYQRALRFMPTSGHAHNQVKKFFSASCIPVIIVPMLQLAVTAMYADAELTALFHYCLSISIKDSFQSGISNLILFFKKNMKSHKDLLSVEEPTGKLTPSSKEGRAAVKATCVKFMRLHGILFEASRRHVDSLMPSSAEELESNIAKSKELDNRSLADFVTLVPEVMDRISRLAVHGLLSEGTLLKMVAISIFSAHRYVFESVNHEATPDLDVDAKNAVNPNLPRSTAGAYALILLFSFVNR